MRLGPFDDVDMAWLSHTTRRPEGELAYAASTVLRRSMAPPRAGRTEGWATQSLVDPVRCTGHVARENALGGQHQANHPGRSSDVPDGTLVESSTSDAPNCPVAL